jgi:hypothetical protein
VPVEVAWPKLLDANTAVLVKGFGDVAKYTYTRGCSPNDATHSKWSGWNGRVAKAVGLRADAGWG